MISVSAQRVCRPTRQIAASLAIGRTTLQGYLDRTSELGLGWPLPPEMSDTDLGDVFARIKALGLQAKSVCNLAHR